MTNSVDVDQVAEPPHQNLHCLQIKIFSSLVFKVSYFILFHIYTYDFIRLRKMYTHCLWRY